MTNENNAPSDSVPDFRVREYQMYDFDGKRITQYGIVECSDVPGQTPVAVMISGIGAPFLTLEAAEEWIDLVYEVNKPVEVPRAPYAETCDGLEQKAWEAWAKSEGLDTGKHPVIYLFLNDKTNAARRAWKAGLMYATQYAKDNATPGYTVEQIAQAAMEAEISDSKFESIVIALRGDGE